MKTRAAGCVGPITTSTNFPQYYVQCQLQIECTGAEFCILQSFHPETNTSKCFLVERNNTLLLIIKEIVDAIYERKKIKTWNHLEIKDLLSFGKNIIGYVPDFVMLKPFRKFIKKLSKFLPVINFRHENNFNILTV